MKKSTTITVKNVQPRNPLVQHAMFRKAGSHRKSNKAARAADRRSIQREYA